MISLWVVRTSVASGPFFCAAVLYYLTDAPHTGGPSFGVISSLLTRMQPRMPPLAWAFIVGLTLFRTKGFADWMPTADGHLLHQSAADDSPNLTLGVH